MVLNYSHMEQTLKEEFLCLQSLIMKHSQLSITLLRSVIEERQCNTTAAQEICVAIIGVLLHCGGAGHPIALATALPPILDVPLENPGTPEEVTGWNVLTSINPDYPVSAL